MEKHIKSQENLSKAIKHIKKNLQKSQESYGGTPWIAREHLLRGLLLSVGIRRQH